MALSLLNILFIVLALVAGLEFPRIGPKAIIQRINALSNLCLYALLVFMGITIGQVPDFFAMLFEVGITALIMAVATSAGIAATLFVVLYLGREAHAVPPPHVRGTGRFAMLSFLKEPVILVGLVCVGFLLTYLRIIPDMHYDLIVTLLLYALIFTIGIKLSFSNIRLSHILTHRLSVVVALCTVLGSYLGALIVSAFMGMSVAETLAVSSGFGWYTLSGILFAKLGQPVTGSIAFMTDLFREVLGLLMLPLLARWGMNRIAIGICGATAMDVSLPVIEKYGTREDVTIGFISGTLITLVVPFLIPLCVAFQ